MPPKYYGDKAISYLRYTLVFHFYHSHPFYFLTLLIFEVDQKFDAENIRIGKRLKWHTIGVSVYSYIVVYTGALVRHTDSGLVCSDWPLCHNNSFELPKNLYEWVQMGHRTAAALIFIWIVIIAIHAIKNYKDQRVFYWGWIIALILVTGQVLTGMTVVLTESESLLSLCFIRF